MAKLGVTSVPYLEAEILFQQKNWAEAIPKLEKARAVLRAESQFTAKISLMLAECYDRVGYDEKSLDALRQVADGERGPESARLAYGRALARADKLGQAIGILSAMTGRDPELRLELTGLLIQKTSRQPTEQRNWPDVEQQLREAEKALPQDVESLALLRLDVLAA